MKSKTIDLGTKAETMAVYNINNKMGPNEYTVFMRNQFDKTGRAELINSKNNDDNLKWGHRIFNLTVAELIEKFDEKYDKSLQIVTKFFESEGLNVQSKHHFSKNMYDFPIKE